jgi:hypothetical protein
LIITTGDNNYPNGDASTIDAHIGQFYSQFIGNYQGSYGSGSEFNRFWPSLGNHDWRDLSCSGNSCTGAHFDYFTLPGNERYYDVDYGLVHLFSLNSDSDEPDGIRPDSLQALWFQETMGNSSACYKLVYFHHPPYSTGYHGSSSIMRWPFVKWGADAVFSGHEHSYERLDVGGFPYFVNGSGGRNLRPFLNIGTLPPEATSVVRYMEDFGAMLVNATTTGITYQFFDISKNKIDELIVPKDCQDPN